MVKHQLYTVVTILWLTYQINNNNVVKIMYICLKETFITIYQLIIKGFLHTQELYICIRRLMNVW